MNGDRGTVLGVRKRKRPVPEDLGTIRKVRSTGKKHRKKVRVRGRHKKAHGNELSERKVRIVSRDRTAQLSVKQAQLSQKVRGTGGRG